MSVQQRVQDVRPISPIDPEELAVLRACPAARPCACAFGEGWEVKRLSYGIGTFRRDGIAEVGFNCVYGFPWQHGPMRVTRGADADGG